MEGREVSQNVQPPHGFRAMKDHPGDDRPVILAHRDKYGEEFDFEGKIDFAVMLARRSKSAPYEAWVALPMDPNDSSACNHGSIAYPIGWLPLPDN